MPISPDMERLVLGGILTSKAGYAQVAAILNADDFGLEKHTRIFRRMAEVVERGDHLDCATLAQELLRYGELETVDGLSYLVSLDDGMPSLPDISAYARIVKDKAIARAVIYTAQHSINLALAGEEASRDLVKGSVSRLIELIPPDASTDPQNPGQIIESYQGGINAFLQPHLHQRGIATGFRKLDDMTGGLYPGEMVILGARPSVGKSGLMLNIAANLALRHQRRPLLFSLEMTKESLLERLICSEARVDSERFRLGYVNAEERQRLQRTAASVADAPLLIDDTSNISVMDIVNKIRSVETTGKVDVVMVDYLQLLRPVGKHDNRTNEINNISRSLKLVAKDYDLSVLSLSQLNRQTEMRRGDGRPQLSDLRDGGGLEADSDVVMFLHRASMYKPDREDLRGLADLIVAKQRKGRCGTIKMAFLEQYVRFEDMADDIPDASEDWKHKQGADGPQDD
jgi:replicative DNA helicase